MGIRFLGVCFVLQLIERILQGLFSDSIVVLVRMFLGLHSRGSFIGLLIMTAHTNRGL